MRLLYIILLFSLTSCDLLSSSKIKSLNELTPTLMTDSFEKIDFHGDLSNPFTRSKLNIKGRSVAAHQVVETITAKGNLYSLDTSGKVIAYSIKDNKKLWTYNFENFSGNSNYYKGGITYNKGDLLITNGTRILIVLNAETGYETVRKEFSDIIQIKPILINNELILVQTVSNNLFAYNLSKGKIVWQHEGLFEPLSYGNQITPLVIGNKVIVNYNSGQIFALNALTGEEYWGLSITSDEAIGLASFDGAGLTYSPVIDRNNLYLASGSGKVLKLDIENGNILWSSKIYDVQSMNIIGNHLFVITNAKQMAALNVSTGKINWVGNLALNDNKRKSKPVLYLAPFPALNENQKEIVVISNIGQAYSFVLRDGVIDNTPRITLIPSGINKYKVSCCAGGLYLIDNKAVYFTNSNIH